MYSVLHFLPLTVARSFHTLCRSGFTVILPLARFG